MKKLILLSIALLSTISCSYRIEDDDIIIIDSNINVNKNDSTTNNKSNNQTSDSTKGTISFGVSDVKEG